jgi:ArsR family transcriptional regulator, arsenate/arsenite/antimonite-responsive transcriptional repressor
MALVASHADGDACASELDNAFDLSQPAISQTLRRCRQRSALPRAGCRAGPAI